MPRNTTTAARNRARAARRNPSVAEQVVWEQLRNEKTGFKFRREHPVGNYRLDFFCREAMLAVELDGEQHDPVRDAARDAALAELEIMVYRVPNIEFFMIGDASKIDHLTAIIRLCEERASRQAF